MNHAKQANQFARLRSGIAAAATQFTVCVARVFAYGPQRLRAGQRNLLRSDLTPIASPKDPFQGSHDTDCAYPGSVSLLCGFSDRSIIGH